MVSSSLRNLASVPAYLYVPPKQRWWPTLLGLVITGACVLAIFGPSQPTGPSGWAVYQVRSGYAILAKYLADAPRQSALNSDGQVHARRVAEFGAAPVLSSSNATDPESATTSIDLSKKPILFEASLARPTPIKRHVRQAIVRSSYASAHQHLHHVGMKSRGRARPSKAYAGHYRHQEMSPYGRYQIVSQGFGY